MLFDSNLAYFQSADLFLKTAVSSRFFAKLSLYPKLTPDFADLISEKHICLTDNNINYFRETNTCVLT